MLNLRMVNILWGIIIISFRVILCLIYGLFEGLIQFNFGLIFLIFS